MENITYDFATEKDRFAIKRLLNENGLPFEDIDDHLRHFIVAKDSGKIIGVVGLQDLSKYVLFRSLAVSVAYRNKGIGKELYKRITEYGKRLGASEMYLLTTTASAYFSKLDFAVSNRESVAKQVKETQEFTGLCPSSAVCMHKKINY